MPDDTSSSLATNEITYNADLLTNQMKWSDTLFSFCGYDRSEPTDTLEWWTEHVHPEDAMTVNQAMDKLFDPKVIEWTVDYRFRLADNSYVPMRDHTAVVRDQSGQAIRLIGSLTPASQ